jgi:hypothetical protein
MIRLGDAAGGTGISLSLGSGASKNSMSINGNPMVNQQGIVTIPRTSSNVTITDSNVTATSIILVTPYGDIGYGNTFWVTISASVSWDIVVATTLGTATDFSYFVVKY